jgi:hypothetical protein
VVKNRSGGTERVMAKRKSEETSPSGQENPGRELIKPETLPTKTSKAKPSPILYPLLCIDPTVETQLAKTGLELLDGCQRIGVAMFPLVKAIDSFSKDMAKVAKSWNRMLEPLFKTAQAFSEILGQWAAEWQKRTPQMLEFWEMTWPKIQPILEFYQAFEEMTPEKRKEVIENGWEIVRKKADREGLSSQEYRLFEVQVGRKEYSGEMEGLFYELLTLGGIFYEEDALCEFKTECIRLKYGLTPADLKRAREFNAVASMWEESASNRGIKALGEVLGTLGRIENDSIRTLECENWSGGTERIITKRNADGTIPGGQEGQETLKSNLEPDRNRYATEEDYRHALDGKGGVFYRNEKGLFVSLTLQTLKEERGFQLAKAFQDFLDASGLDFEGDLSMEQCEGALLRVGLPVPDLEKQSFGLAGFLNFWKPGKCGHWLTQLWHSGQNGLARLKESGIWDSCAMELFRRYLELELRSESREAENMRCRILTTWAFAVPWCVEAVRLEQNGEQRTETGVVTQPVKNESSPIRTNQSYPPEVEGHIIASRLRGVKWKEIIDECQSIYGVRITEVTGRKVIERAKKRREEEEANS